MKEFQRQVMLKVGAIHLIVIALMILVPMLHGCFQPKPPKEIVTFIELGAPAPAVSVETVANLPEPAQPEPPPKVEPPPERIPDPTPIKKPPVKKPDPPKKKPPVKKKIKYTKAKDIKIGPKVKSSQPKQPTVDTSALERELSTIKKRTGTSAGSPDQFAGYYRQIFNLLYGQWSPPAASNPNNTTTVRLYILKNGTITRRVKQSKSGDPLFDRTVMEAVNAVNMLPKPPANFNKNYVDVYFEVQ